MKKQKGITLIALIVTIVVLLILAGVSIAMLTGDNGIITQAQNAKIETEKASTIESVQLEVLGSFDATGKINTELLTEKLKNIEGLTYNGEEIDKEINPITSLPAMLELNGHSIRVKASGTVEFKNPEIPISERSKGWRFCKL